MSYSLSLNPKWRVTALTTSLVRNSKIVFVISFLLIFRPNITILLTFIKFTLHKLVKGTENYEHHHKSYSDFQVNVSDHENVSELVDHSVVFYFYFLSNFFQNYLDCNKTISLSPLWAYKESAMGKNDTNLPDVFEICLLEIVQNDLHFTQIFFWGFFRILLREIPMYLHCSRPSVALF